MEFNDQAKIDTSQIQDVRASGGSSSGGGLSLPNIPGGLGGLGGGLGVVGVIIFVVIQLLSGSSGTPSNALDTSQVSGGDVSTCHTGADTTNRADCRVALVVNSVQEFWAQYLPANTGQKVQYTKALTQFFSQGTETGCGQATAAVGPFYCPADKKVYIDLSFFSLMQKELGAKDVPFVEAYVLAHEYGHHIQDLLGTMSEAQQLGQQGANSGSVRLELQADCYAGVWANHATGTTDSNGVKIISNISDSDIQDGLAAAQAIGDDHIQSSSGGGVHPDTFTHGTSAQRYKWFKTGIDTGDMSKCDTFSGNI